MCVQNIEDGMGHLVDAIGIEAQHNYAGGMRTTASLITFWFS